MKFLVAFTLGFLSYCGQILAFVENKPEFVIVVPSYNNEKYAEANLKSICHQNSTNSYQIICVNDCSTDRTGEIMENYIKEHNLRSRVTIVHNEKRVGSLANIYNTIHNRIPSHKVVVLCDGDDMLRDNDVLLALEEAYSEPDIWITYGSTVKIPSGETDLSRDLPDWVLEKKKLREYPFVTQWLRTFKAALFKKIRKEDLLYKGNFFKMTGDMAFMFPMIEMAAPTAPDKKNHSKFIKKILYIYRANTGLNDHTVDRELQKSIERFIRQMPPYEPLDSLEV